MSIADQITRLNNAKAAIKQSIEKKGVSVSDTALLDEYPALIDKIEVGSGGSEGNSYYEDLFTIRTNNGLNFAYLFHSCNAKSLDVSNLDTSKATDMKNMFYYCRSLTSLDLSSFDTKNVTTMSYMFYYCMLLTSLNVSSFDTSNVTSMENMFNNCTQLTELDVSNFDTNKVVYMNYMFSNCSKLTELNINHFDTKNVTTMSYIFSGCTSLTSLDLSNWDASKVTSSSGLNIFGSTNMPQLIDFNAPKNIGVPFDVSRCPNLTHDSLMSIINNLATVTSSKKLTLGATNLAKLTDEEKAIATGKKWTLA